MGTHPNITHEKFPKQSDWVGKKASVCFHYDTSHRLPGVIVRDDLEAPFGGIIKLDNGKYVLMTECQFQPEN